MKSIFYLKLFVYLVNDLRKLTHYLKEKNEITFIINNNLLFLFKKQLNKN